MVLYISFRFNDTRYQMQISIIYQVHMWHPALESHHLAQISVSWFPELISKTDELGVNLKCVGCISAEKQWVILWVGGSNQQPDLAIVMSVGIFDNFQSMSIRFLRQKGGVLWTLVSSSTFEFNIVYPAPTSCFKRLPDHRSAFIPSENQHKADQAKWWPFMYLDLTLKSVVSLDSKSSQMLAHWGTL